MLRGEKKIGQVRGEAERATGNEGKLNEERVRNGDVALNRMRNNNNNKKKHTTMRRKEKRK